jgi:tripartite-type tricarboxylate transporter receptor subunit TctC
MRMPTRVVAVASLAAVAAGSMAQSYPARPIRLVVPLAPGGTNDTLARLISDRMAAKLGQQVVVDNRPGANSQIGSALVARANPDGHTLLMTGAGHATNPSLQRSLPYDTERDFAPIGVVAGGPYLMVIPPVIPAKTVKEFVVWAKARPGQLSYGSASLGSPTHLAGELFNIATGTELLHVPYKGGSALMPDLLSGRLAMTFSSISTVRSNMQAGRLRPLAVSTVKRSEFLPDVPTFGESGYPSVEINAWYGLFTTGSTPVAIVQRLSTALRETLAEPAVQEAFLKQGLNPQPTSVEEFQKLIASEIVKWAKVVRSAGIKLE